MPEQKSFSFTVQTIQNLLPPSKGFSTFRDSKNPFLQLYITQSGSKTFFIRKRVHGQNKRITIGAFPGVTIEQARKQALSLMGQISNGSDPTKEAAELKRRQITFGEHFYEYMERYSKVFKKSWQYDEVEIQRFMLKWYKKPLSEISRFDIEKLHHKIGKENGKTQANTILRRLSAIFNKAIEWGWDGKNPTKGVKKFKEVTRDRFILPHEMPYFRKAIDQEENQTCKDFILILLLTGARKTNTLDMAWNDINWDLREWRIPETKNGEPLKLPLLDNTLEILKRRKSISNSKWVFAQENNPIKRIIDPTKAWNRIRGVATLLMWNDDEKTAIWLKDAMRTVRSYLSPHLKVIRLNKLAEAQGFPLPGSLLDIRLHDIRRTFGSYQALTGASLQIIGKSLGHKSQRTTQIYSRLNLDPVRDSMNKAVDQMFSL